MRTTPARKKVYDYLGTSLPTVWDRLRVDWAPEGESLPDGLVKGQMEFDNLSESDEVIAYLSPQEVRVIDQRLPVIAVSAAISQPWEPTEHVDALSEEFRGTHQMQVYCWTAVEDWTDLSDAIESLAGSIAYAMALDQSLGDSADGIKLDPRSISISYSEPEAHGGNGGLAGAAIAFLLSSEDIVSQIASGIVETTEAAVHPALEG